MKRARLSSRKHQLESRSRSKRVDASGPLSDRAAGGAGNQALEQTINGVALDPQVRADMEARFGADFSGVRIHDNPAAHALAARYGAKAYTFGNQIVFGADNFAPHSVDGRALLAHELAHVVQQSRGDVCGAEPAGSVALESGAEAAANAVSAGSTNVAVTGASSVGVARSPKDDPDSQPIKVIEDPAAGKVRVVRVDERGAIIAGLAELTPAAGSKPDRNQVTVGFNVSESGEKRQPRITVPPDWQAATNPAHPIAVQKSDIEFLDADVVTSAKGEERAARRREVAAFFEEKPWLDYARILAWPNSTTDADVDAVYKLEEFVAWQQARASKAHRQKSERLSSFYQQQFLQQGIELPLEQAREVWEMYNPPAQTEWEQTNAARPGGLPNEIRDKDTGELLGYRTVGFADKYSWTTGVGIVTYTTLDRHGNVVGTPQEVTVLSPDADAIQSILRGAPITGNIINAAEVGGLSLDLRDLGRFLSEGERVDRLVAAVPFGDTVRHSLEAGTGVSASGKDIDPLLSGGDARILSDRERLGKGALVVVDVAGEALGVTANVKPKVPKPDLDIGLLRSQRSVVPDVDTPRTRMPRGAASDKPDVDVGPQHTVSAARSADVPSNNGPTVAADATKSLPDKGLADRGYRASPGERNNSRARYEAEQGALRWKRSVDEWAERAFGPDPSDAIEVPRVRGRQQPRIGDKRVPNRPPRRLDLQDIPLLPGETPRQGLVRVRTVFGKTLADYPYLRTLWDDARARVLRGRTLTADNYGELYDLTRDAFWRRVRGDTPDAQQARALLSNAGFELPAANTRAPQLANVNPALRRTEHSISLDHIEEKGQGLGWQKALDADNLRMEPAMPNTHRENVQMRHRELRPGASAAVGPSQFPQRRDTPTAALASTSRATPDSAIADEALIDAALAGKLREFLDQDDLIEAALRGDLHELLHGSGGISSPRSGSATSVEAGADVDPKVRQALHDLVGTDDELAEQALEVLRLHVKQGDH